MDIIALHYPPCCYHLESLVLVLFTVCVLLEPSFLKINCLTNIAVCYEVQTILEAESVLCQVCTGTRNLLLCHIQSNSGTEYNVWCCSILPDQYLVLISQSLPCTHS